MIALKQILVDILASRPRASRWVRAVARPRPFILYGVGAPKTGTKSVAAMFQACFRARHEARYSEFSEVLPARLSGEMDDRQARAWLRDRDATLWLECEAGHPLAWFADALAEEFQQARFLLTVRDCHSWLDSVLDQHRNVPNPRTNLREIAFGGDFKYETDVLAELGEYPLAAYLSYWARHNTKVLDSVPADRLLVVPTQRLSHSLERIAEFVGTDPEKLRAGPHHVHKAPRKHHVLDRIPRALFLARVEQYCRPTIDRLAARPELAEYDLVGAPLAL